MRLVVDDRLSLSEYVAEDAAACVAHLNDPVIHAGTLRIPSPYRTQDFDDWLDHVETETQRLGEPANFAIRDADGGLIGGIGFDAIVRGHCAEIGYWLASPWRGRGAMMRVVAVACADAVARFDLVRITAHVFEFNVASARVLEKNGFRCEGLLRKRALKDGRFLDCRLFALVR